MAQEPNRRDDSQRVLRRAPLILIIILLLAFVARGLVAYQQASQAAESQDRVTNIYLTVANNILLRNEFVSHAGRRAEVMPGYPTFVAGVFKLFGKGPPGTAGLIPLALLQAVISTLTIVVVYDLGRRISGSWAGLAAAALLTINPMHILSCGRVSPMTLAVFLFVLFIWSVVLFRESFRFADAILAGVLFSASVYVSASVILLAPLLLVPLAIGGQRKACFSGWVTGAVVLLVALSPWVVRNWRVFDRFAVTTTSVGENIYAGLEPDGASARQLAAHTRSMNKVLRDRAYRSAAWGEIVKNSHRFTGLAWKKTKALWNPGTSTAEKDGKLYEILSYSTFFPTLILAAVGIVALLRRKVWAMALMLTPALYWTILEAFRVGSPEHRISAMPMIMVLSGTGLAWIFSREVSATAEKKKQD